MRYLLAQVRLRYRIGVVSRLCAGICLNCYFSRRQELCGKLLTLREQSSVDRMIVHGEVRCQGRATAVFGPASMLKRECAGKWLRG